MQLRESKLVVALAAALTVGSVGCDDGGLTGPEDGSIYSDGAAASATVSGYVWDTEAYWSSADTKRSKSARSKGRLRVRRRTFWTSGRAATNAPW